MYDPRMVLHSNYYLDSLNLKPSNIINIKQQRNLIAPFTRLQYYTTCIFVCSNNPILYKQYKNSRLPITEESINKLNDQKAIIMSTLRLLL